MAGGSSGSDNKPLKKVKTKHTSRAVELAIEQLKEGVRKHVDIAKSSTNTDRHRSAARQEVARAVAVYTPGTREDQALLFS
jgi:hypothetical protein